MWKVAGLILTAVLLAAVGLLMYWLRSPQDLQITGIQMVRRIEVPRSDEPGRASDPSLPLVVIRFRSSSDLASLANNFIYQGLYAHYFLCGSGMRISEGTNLVFDQFGRISFGESSNHDSITKEYHVYLALRSVGIPGFSRYDLVRSPEDVCLMLVPESTEFGDGVKTNIMRITRRSIKGALLSLSQ